MQNSTYSQSFIFTQCRGRNRRRLHIRLDGDTEHRGRARSGQRACLWTPGPRHGTLGGGT